VAAPRGAAGPALPRGVYVSAAPPRGYRARHASQQAIAGPQPATGRGRGRDPRPKSTETPRKPDNDTDLQKLLKLCQIIRVFCRLHLTGLKLPAGVRQIDAVRLYVKRATTLSGYSRKSFISLVVYVYSTCFRPNRQFRLPGLHARRRTGAGWSCLLTPIKGGSERLSADRPVTGVATLRQRAVPALTGVAPYERRAAV
jgi:hypothetical protein